MIHQHIISEERRAELAAMEPSEVVGGLCVKQDGYIITFFKEGLDGPPVCKIKKVGGEPFKPG